MKRNQNLAQARRRLKVGIIRDGRMVEERVLPEARGLTIGSGRRATLTLRGAQVEKKQALFIPQAGRYGLVLTPGLRGRLSLETGGSLALEELWQLATPRADGTRVYPLLEGHRGRVQLDPYSVVFQFVTPPEPLPRATWRKALQTRVRRADPVWAGVVLCCSLLHLALVQLVQASPPPKPETLESVKDVFVHYRLVPPKPVSRAPVPAETPRPRRTTRVSAHTPSQAPEARQPEAPLPARGLSDRVNHGIIKVLSTMAPGSAEGPLGQVIRGDVGKEDLTALLRRGAPGLMTSREAVVPGLRPVAEDGGLIGSSQVVTSVSQATEVTTRVRVAKAVPVRVEKAEVSGGQRQGIEQVYKLNSGAVENCYTIALRTNPLLQGKYYLELSIAPNGRVASATVRAAQGGGDEKFCSCLEKRVQTWIFRGQTEQDTDVIFPIVLTPVN